MTLLIELGQGDSDYVDVVLSENGTAADLSGYTLTFSMSKGKTEFPIPCTTNETTPLSEGGARISFTEVETAYAKTYEGKIYAVMGGEQVTFPSGNEYIIVKIYPKV